MGTADAEIEADGIKRRQELANQAIKELKAQQLDSDIEIAHVNADDVLCQLLIELGFEDVVKEYHYVRKWYA